MSTVNVSVPTIRFQRFMVLGKPIRDPIVETLMEVCVSALWSHFHQGQHGWRRGILWQIHLWRHRHGRHGIQQGQDYVQVELDGSHARRLVQPQVGFAQDMGSPQRLETDARQRCTSCQTQDLGPFTGPTLLQQGGELLVGEACGRRHEAKVYDSPQGRFTGDVVPSFFLQNEASQRATSGGRLRQRRHVQIAQQMSEEARGKVVQQVELAVFGRAALA